MKRGILTTPWLFRSYQNLGASGEFLQPQRCIKSRRNQQALVVTLQTQYQRITEDANL